MQEAALALGMAALIFAASVISIKAAVSVAIVEIMVGVIGGNFLGLHTTEWVDFLAGFAGILLTFLAGAEVDPDLFREKFKESMWIGSLSFFAPFTLAVLFCYYLGGWSWNASLIAGCALSTTSLAVIYAVLVETGLTETPIGKLIMAACFVTDIGTALALSLVFAEGNVYTIVFVFVSAGLIWLGPKFIPSLFKRFGNRVIEPEVKFLFLLLFLFMYIAKLGKSHAVLPVFVFGLALSRYFRGNRDLQRKVRIIGFAMVTPFFFIKGGMNVNLQDLAANMGLLGGLFAVKMVAKIAGVYPLAKKYAPEDASYTTLLMSTGLTFGTISSMYGLSAGFIDRTQFSLLVATVILTAVVPTFIAQRWFEPEPPEAEYVYEAIPEGSQREER
ncbi:MAG: cation:proton antiporter [Deltaproteobacteria bacterium]|nr:cation:proton antiporter [Deltaproteobacteria bacterium]